MNTLPPMFKKYTDVHYRLMYLFQLMKPFLECLTNQNIQYTLVYILQLMKTLPPIFKHIQMFNPHYFIFCN